MQKILIAGETRDFKIEENASEHPLERTHAVHPGDVDPRMISSLDWMLLAQDALLGSDPDWMPLLQQMKQTRILIYGTFMTREAYPFLGDSIQRCGYFIPEETLSTVDLAHILSAPESFAEAYMVAGLIVDLHMRKVLLNGLDLVLTPMEFELMRFLIRHPNQALSRDTLIKGVWGYSFLGDSRTIDTHIKSLRKKLGSHRKLIKTVWGSGYRFLVC